MKRIVLMAGGLLLGGILSGCATEAFVRQQVAPLNDRLGSLEMKVDALGKTAGMTELSPVDRQSFKDTHDMAQKALDEINRLAPTLKRGEAAALLAEAAAKRAEEAAVLAEAAAKRAEEAAVLAGNSAGKAGQSEKKSEKIFELQQKK